MVSGGPSTQRMLMSDRWEYGEEQSGWVSRKLPSEKAALRRLHTICFRLRGALELTNYRAEGG